MKNNAYKTVLLIFTGIILGIFLTSTCIDVYRKAVKKHEAQVKEKAIDKASKNGYNAEFIEKKKFFIEDNEVKYYFLIDASGVCFDECEFEVQEDGVKVKDGALLISIRHKDNNNISVRCDDTRIILLDDGTEKAMYSGMFFISNTDFDKESFVINSFVPDAEQKALEAYNTIMKYTSADKLKKEYNQALAICKLLNA